MSEEAQARVLEQAEALGVSHANLGLFEVNGSFRSKRYNVRHLKKAMTDGVAWFAVPSGFHPAEDVILSNPFIHPSSGYQDGVVKMDPSSLRSMPFDSDGRGLLLIGQFTGALADHCVRALLARELERLATAGFDLYGGLELEGTVLLETAETLRRKRPDEVTVAPGFAGLYSFVDQAGQSPLIDELISSCNAMGLPLDTAHPEYAQMLEVALEPQTGLRIADNAALYKAVAKIVAARNGAYVSFMARRNSVDQGCGAHINVSLRHKGTEETAFYDPDREDRLSDTLRHFVGGLHCYLPELFLLLAPHLNSYKRFQAGLVTPLNNTWGINNKTVAFRVVNVTPAAARVEVRSAGADLCPHLALLAVSAAGRLGIEQRLEPPAPIDGNGWEVEKPEGPPLPLRFEEAIERFAGSEVAKDVLSEGFVETFVGDRRWQLEEFSRTVTDWELSMFGTL